MSGKKKLSVWSVIGVFILFLMAAGWHFLYSDVFRSCLTAVMAPVNESPWEHAKLFFVPAVIWYVILYFIAGKRFPNFIFSYAIALIIMPVLMFGLYYAYRLFIPDSLAADIILTFIVIALGQLTAYKLTVSKYGLSGPMFTAAAAAIVFGLLVLYTVFTFIPPHFDVFMDPRNGRYGI